MPIKWLSLFELALTHCGRMISIGVKAGGLNVSLMTVLWISRLDPSKQRVIRWDVDTA